MSMNYQCKKAREGLLAKVKKNKGMTPSQISQATGVSTSRVHDLIGGNNIPRNMVEKVQAWIDAPQD